MLVFEVGEADRSFRLPELLFDRVDLRVRRQDP
jgi:hypothetical protein